MEFFQSVAVAFLYVVWVILFLPNVIQGLRDNEGELGDWSLYNVPNGLDTLRPLLSAEEFEHVHETGSIQHAFVVRFSALAHVQKITLRTEYQSIAYFIWSRRSGEGWTSVRNIKNDRKIFHARRSSKSIRNSLPERVFPLTADELLFLPLRSTVLYKSKLSARSDLQLRFFGNSQSEGTCHCFDGTGDNRLVYDLKRHGPIADIDGGFSFLIKTRAYNGVVFSSHGTQGDFVLVQLRRSRLVVVINFGGNNPRVLASTVLVNDGVWHRISMQYHYDDCTLYVDGVAVASSAPPLLGYRVDLDKQVLIGGAPFTLPYLKFMVAENFSGCIDNLTWNDRKLDLSPLEYRRKCPSVPVPEGPKLLAFTNGDAWIEKRGRLHKRVDSGVEFLFAVRLSGRFRTLSERGDIWRAVDNDRHPWSDSLSNLSVSLTDGIVSCRLVLDGDAFTLRSRRRVNDGLWHQFKLNLQSHLVELVVDDQPIVRLEAKFKILAPPDGVYIVGGSGFIGCIEQLTIDGQEENLVQYERRSPLQKGDEPGIIWDQCPLWDRCHPNPCANKGVCQQSVWNDFVCICRHGYSGSLCSNVDFPHNCQEYREFQLRHHQSSEPLIKIDLDDTGPLRALEVECREDGSTVLFHSRTEPVEIYGFMDRGSAMIDYKYGRVDQDALFALAVAALTKRSMECRQEVSYKCFGGASLMGTRRDLGRGQLERSPSSWWLSWTATHVYAWGDGEPDSMMCSCAVFGTCSGNASCNCDGINGTNSEDIGNVTRKELLPIRRVLAGDTDFGNKRSVINVGPLICAGDESSNTVTFLDRGSFIEIPFQSGASVNEPELSGYLQFRTRECLLSLLATRRIGQQDDGCEYLQLHVEDCRTAVLTVCGGGGVTKLRANFTQLIDSDTWHSVKFVVTATSILLLLDNDESTKTSLYHLYTSPETDLLSAWRLGATGDRGSGFTGAMRSVFLNGRLATVSDLGASGRISGEVKSGLVNRCVLLDEHGVEDESWYCYNGGRCEELYYKISCDCSATPFSGSRCHQDVSYDLVGAMTFSNDVGRDPPTTSTMNGVDFATSAVDYLRLGFQTRSLRSALLRGHDRRTKTDVFALLITDAGTLRLLYTDSYTPYTIEEDGRNFADGYFHDVIVRVDAENGSISMEVDHFRTRTLDWRYPNGVRPSLVALDWTVGDDGLASLFSGCVSRLQIGRSFFPFKSFGAMLRAVADGGSGTLYRKSVCPAVEDNLLDDVYTSHRDAASRVNDLRTTSFDTTPRWLDPPRLKIRPKKERTDRSVILGGIALATLCILLMLVICLIRVCTNRPAGEYKTHEETLYLTGPLSGHDSSQQALVSAAGVDRSPSPVERREWFI